MRLVPGEQWVVRLLTLRSRVRLALTCLVTLGCSIPIMILCLLGSVVVRIRVTEVEVSGLRLKCVQSRLTGPFSVPLIVMCVTLFGKGVM